LVSFTATFKSFTAARLKFASHAGLKGHPLVVVGLPPGRIQRATSNTATPQAASTHVLLLVPIHRLPVTVAVHLVLEQHDVGDHGNERDDQGGNEIHVHVVS
jgi:hypothetical protein